MTADLTAFLLARIEADEAAARWALIQAHAVHDVVWPDGSVQANAEALVAGWPARVLAECAAKRAIVALHPVSGGWEDDDMNDHGHGCSTCGYDARYADTGECETVRILAAVYASHPDCDPEWAL